MDALPDHWGDGATAWYRIMWLLHFCRSGTSQNLEVAGLLINVIVEANIFGWNDIGMLCADNQYSSTLF